MKLNSLILVASIYFTMPFLTVNASAVSVSSLRGTKTETQTKDREQPSQQEQPQEREQRDLFIDTCAGDLVWTDCLPSNPPTCGNQGNQFEPEGPGFFCYPGCTCPTNKYRVVGTNECVRWRDC